MNDSEKSKEVLISEIEELKKKLFFCEKELEEKKDLAILLQGIIDHNPVSIQLLDKNGYTTWVNPAFVDLFGTEPGPDVPMFGDSQLMDQGLRENFKRLRCGEVVFFPGAYYNAKKKRTTYPDKEVYVEAVGFPLFDKTNQPERFVMMHVDLTERKKKEKESKQLYEQLRQLAGHLETEREDERKKLARELHDELGTTLNGVSLRLKLLKPKLQHADDISEFDFLIKALDDTYREVMQMHSKLRMEEIVNKGLKKAMEDYAGNFGLKHRLNIYLNIENHLATNYDVSFVIYKVLVLALNNVALHAKADTVDLWLHQNGDQLELIIADNGLGINPKEIHAKTSHGIISMRERTQQLGGQFDICPGADRGTTITVRIPFTNTQIL